MNRFVASALALAVLLVMFSGCSSGPAPAGTSVPATTVAAAPVTTEAPATESPVSTAGVNEKGPFDEDHRRIGLQALQTVDSYLAGDLTDAGASKALTACYDEIKALPELPESDPFSAGNGFVRAYVFLAYIDFSTQPSDFATKKYDDRNYLAAALGEPEKEFDIPAVYQAVVGDYLDDLLGEMQAKFPEYLFAHSWDDEGDLFISLSIHDFDYYFEHKATLSEKDRSNVLEASHGYVAGAFAESIYESVRQVGGDAFDVYIVLSGSDIFCASKNLEIFMDPLNE